MNHIKYFFLYGMAFVFFLGGAASVYAHAESNLSTTPKRGRAGGATFSENIRLGSRGQAVRDLQSILKLDQAIYPEGVVSGYFGPATERAVKRFQQKHGVVKSGDARAIKYGAAGSETNAMLRKLSDPKGERFQ